MYERGGGAGWRERKGVFDTFLPLSCCCGLATEFVEEGAIDYASMIASQRNPVKVANIRGKRGAGKEKGWVVHREFC